MEISKKRLVEIINEEIVSMADLEEAPEEPLQVPGVSPAYREALAALNALSPAEKAILATHLGAGAVD